MPGARKSMGPPRRGWAARPRARRRPAAAPGCRGQKEMDSPAGASASARCGPGARQGGHASTSPASSPAPRRRRRDRPPGAPVRAERIAGRRPGRGPPPRRRRSGAGRRPPGVGGRPQVRRAELAPASQAVRRRHRGGLAVVATRYSPGDSSVTVAPSRSPGRPRRAPAGAPKRISSPRRRSSSAGVPGPTTWPWSTMTTRSASFSASSRSGGHQHADAVVAAPGSPRG